MSAKAKIFNPADFLPSDQKDQAAATEEKFSEFPLTGNSSRDHVRKRLFQIFANEFSDQADKVGVLVDAIENEVSAMHKEPKSKEYREKTNSIMIKLDKKTPALQEVRAQLMSGEIQASTLLKDDFLSAKAQRPGMSNANAKGPQSGMPSFGGPGARPGGPRGIAAPGQAVRPRGVPFATAARPGAQAPRAMIRPIGAVNQRPSSSMRRDQESPISQLQESGIEFNTQESAFIEKYESNPEDQNIPRNEGHAPAEAQIQIFQQQQTIEHDHPDSSTLNNTGVLIMDISQNTTGPQLDNSLQPSFEASLDDSKTTPEKDTGQDISRKKKKKKVKKVRVESRQDDFSDQQTVDQSMEIHRSSITEQLDQRTELTNSHAPSNIEESVQQFKQDTQEAQHEQHIQANESVPQAQHNIQPERIESNFELQVSSFEEGQGFEAPINFQQDAVQEQAMLEVPEHQDEQNKDRFLARFDSVRIKNEYSRPEVGDMSGNTHQQPQMHEERADFIRVPVLIQERQEEQIITTEIRDTESHFQSAPDQTANQEFKFNAEARNVASNAHNIVLENEISLLQRKMKLIADENRQLREQLRQSRHRVQQVEEQVAGNQTKDGYQLKLLQAQLKNKDLIIEKLKAENSKAIEGRDLYRNKVLQIQKESQSYREQIDRQIQSILTSRAQVSTFEDVVMPDIPQKQRKQTLNANAPIQESNPSYKNAEASNQQEFRKDIMHMMTQQYESQLEEKETELQTRINQQRFGDGIKMESTNDHHLGPSLNIFGGSGSFTGARQNQSNSMNANQNPQHIGLGQQREKKREQRYIASIAQDAGSSQTTIMMGVENLSHNSSNPGSGNLASTANIGMQLFMDVGENDEGGREGEPYFQEMAQDEGTGGESYNQQNPPNMTMIHPPQSSSGSGQQWVNHGAGSGSVGRASVFYGVGGDEQMRFQPHGGGVGDGFDGGYGNAVEEDSADDSHDDDYNSEPERVRALDQEDTDPEEQDCYKHFAYSGDSYGQHTNQQMLHANSQHVQKDVRYHSRQMIAGQQRMDIGGYQDEMGDIAEQEMAALGQEIQNDYGAMTEKIAINDSEPEDGRERDKTHHLKDADGTGENVEGDLDGDGDLSNSNLNDEDIMGDEAHSAPAGGDFQEGDFDDVERSRGEEGGCREMINDGEDGIENLDLLEDGLLPDEPNEQVDFSKPPMRQAAVESTQNQYGTQGSIGSSRFQVQLGGQKYIASAQRDQSEQQEEEEGGEGLPGRDFHNGGNFEDVEDIYSGRNDFEFGYYRSNQQVDMPHQEHNIQGLSRNQMKKDKTWREKGNTISIPFNQDENSLEEEKIMSNSQAYNNQQQHSGQNHQLFQNQNSATQVVGQGNSGLKNQISGAINDFGERPQHFLPARQANRQQLAPQSQMGQGQSAGASSRPASKAGAAASSNHQYSLAINHFNPGTNVNNQEESSNGGASVICQTNSVGAAATSARRISANNSNTPSMQIGIGGQRNNVPPLTSSIQSAAQIRNPRQRNNKQTRQVGVGLGGNLQRQHQTQSSSQTRVQGQGGRNTRGTQRSNLQFATIMQGAPSGGGETQMTQQLQASGSSKSLHKTQEVQQIQAVNSQQQHLYSQNLQNQIPGGSNQASAAGAQNSGRQRASGGGTSSPNSALLTNQQNSFSMASESTFGEIGPTMGTNSVQQMMGNAQSSSVASGGSNQNTGSVSTMALSQLPASHASATHKIHKPSILQRQPGVMTMHPSNQRFAPQNRPGPAGATALINQPKGVVHTANQATSGRANENGVASLSAAGGMDPGSGSGGAGALNAPSQSLTNSRHQSEINAESGSTSLTNQSKYLQNNGVLAQPASQNQQTNYSQDSSNQMSGAQTSALLQVSSPPSTQQTGGNTSHQQHSNGLPQETHNQASQPADTQSNICGETDFYVGAVGAPPSRAAVISQQYKGAQGHQSAGNTIIAQTNQGSGFSGNSQHPQNRIHMNFVAREEAKVRSSQQAANANQASQAAQQMHQNHQRAAKNSSANNSQSQASNIPQQPFEYYQNTSNHQSQNATEISGGSEQQSIERMPPQSSSVTQHYQQYQRSQMPSSRISAATGEQESLPLQGLSDRQRNNQVYHQGVRGMLQSSGGSGFNNSSFSNEPQLNMRQIQRQERSNIQDSLQQNTIWNDQNQGMILSNIQTGATDQSKSQQMNREAWMPRKFNFEDLPQNEGIQSSQIQAASGSNLSLQLQQREDSRKTSGANTPSKDGADTPTYRNEQSQLQKRTNDSQIFNLTSKKLLVLQNHEETKRDGSAAGDGQEPADMCPQDLFE